MSINKKNKVRGCKKCKEKIVLSFFLTFSPESSRATGVARKDNGNHDVKTANLSLTDSRSATQTSHRERKQCSSLKFPLPRKRRS